METSSSKFSHKETYISCGALSMCHECRQTQATGGSPQYNLNQADGHIGDLQMHYDASVLEFKMS
jgi:hypothetical protein